MPRKRAGKGAGEKPALDVIEGGQSAAPEKPAKKPREKKAAATPKAPPRNIEALSEEQRQALHLHHTDKIQNLVKAKDAAVAAIRTARKIAKSDLGETGLKDVDVALKFRKPAGEVEMRQLVDTIIRVAQWEGADIGQQLTLLDTVPPRDWFEEGKRSGIRGEALRFPDGISQKDQQTYGRGHETGKQSLIDAFGSTQPLADKAREEIAATHRGEAAAPEPDLRGRNQKRAEMEKREGRPVTEEEIDAEPEIGTVAASHRTKH